LVNLVKYDDENFSSEGWLQVLHEKKLIDDLLSGKITLFVEHVDETTIGKIIAKEEEKDKDDSTLEDNGLNAATIKVKAIQQEEEHSNEVSTKFEEELQLLEDWLETPCFDGACTNVAVADNRNEESLNEDGIEWEATMDTSDEVHDIMMLWSPEEIIFYYELMLPKIDDQKLNGE
jgi:hypothetical protein